MWCQKRSALLPATVISPRLASASLYIALIDYDEALSSLVITILIGHRCRNTEGGQGEDFTRYSERGQTAPLRSTHSFSLTFLFLLFHNMNLKTDFSVWLPLVVTIDQSATVKSIFLFYAV